MSLKLDANICKAVNFSLQQNHFPIIRSLILTNDGEQPLENLTIKAAAAFASPFSREIAIINAGESLRLKDINIQLSADYLFRLEEKLSGNMVISIMQGETVLFQEAYPVEVLPYDTWSGAGLIPESVCAFITPNNPAVAEIINNGGKLLEEWSGSPSFTGYQSKNPDTAYKQAAAIYGGIQAKNITYCVPPASFEPIGQRIRTIDTILSQKLATCLDMAAMFASCLEFAGLNPIIIFLEGHAFAGCWLTDQSFPECIQDDVSLLTKRAAEGINEICLFECTAPLAGKNLSFKDACKSALDTLKTGAFQFFIDVKRARAGGIRPIPLRTKNAAGEYQYIAPKEEAVPKGEKPEEIKLLSGKSVSGEIGKRQMWERKLLDLSLRNTLISFRVTKNSMQLVVPELAELEDKLAEGAEFSLLEMPSELTHGTPEGKIYRIEPEKEVEKLLLGEFENKRLRTFYSKEETDKALKNIYRSAKQSLEENGANTLYLALGFLRWYENDMSEKPRFAPLILYPVDLIRKSAAKGYIMRVRDEEPQINVTLLEMLRVDFGLSISGLDPLPMDESGIDTKLIFSEIRKGIMSKSRWDVESLAFLGLFGFSQFIMWNDLKNRGDELEKNKVVKSLIAGCAQWEQKTDFPSPDNIDDNYSPLDNAVPMSADSSQLAAICAAGAGESFVLHGPPGTGKSQTITNMIANALYQGKTVLFIAEKMAALSVVQKRLEKVGISPFCLELHSNKAKKKDVLSQLEQTLAIGKIKPPEDYQSEGQRLWKLRKELNETMRLIHKRQKSGFTLYDAIGQYEIYKDSAPVLHFDNQFLSDLTPEIYRECEDGLRQLEAAAGLIGDPANHPLKAMRNVSYSQGLKAELTELLPQMESRGKRLKEFSEKLSPHLGEIDTLKKLEQISELFLILADGKPIEKELFLKADTEYASYVPQILETGEEAAGIKNELSGTFTESFFTFDCESALGEWNVAESKWALSKSIGQNKVYKSVQALAKQPIQKENTPEYLKKAVELKENEKKLTESNSLMSQLFGNNWKNMGYGSLKEQFATAAAAGKKIKEAGCDLEKAANICCDFGSFMRNNSELTSDLSGEIKAFSSLWEKVGEKTGLITLSGEENIESLAEESSRLSSGVNDLREWSGYRQSAVRLEKLGVGVIPSMLEQGVISTDKILPAFYRNIAQDIASGIMEGGQGNLNSFNGTIFQSEIDSYRECADNFARLTQNELIARLSSKIPSSAGAAAGSETGILQKAIRSGGRMLSIRKLFDSIPNLLRRLCPCMLMSPISAAQYIDPSYPPFDLVIFDEASQMPTCEAVGAIARGKELIVVGDPKQLPPTSFFDTMRTDEENYDKEDLESILDDCLALSMPQEHLLWHYRSRHESLIAFSNNNYYDNKLYTFPSPDDTVSKVRHILVEGSYDRGGTKRNKAEAKAVVDEIVRRLKDSQLSKQSIGVVTFSSVQQELIDDMLLEALTADPELENKAAHMYEPIFVKNLENVQGDERDVIMFSVGYGPDENGKVTLNFGPLNRDGGWRRLNVAVSRARYEMLIFSVLRSEQIDPDRSGSDGVLGLKAFLEFADRGKNALPTRETGDVRHTDRLIRSVAEKLESAGYKVNVNIGCSAYKMDIGVLDDDGEYILGVMLDGDSYAAAGTARDRNIGQESVLRSLGWSLHRVWAIDWWEDPDKELEKIKAAIEQAKKNKAEGKEQIPPKTEEQPLKYEKLEEPAQQLTVYTPAVLQPAGNSDDFFDKENDNVIATQITEVLEKEAPIERSLLYRRILSAWDISRKTVKQEQRLQELLDKAGAMVTSPEGREFIWKAGQMPFQYRTFRIPGEGEKRASDEIPPQEYAAAAEFIIKGELGIPEEDIIKQVGKLMGFSRVTDPMKKLIKEGLDTAMRQGWMTKQEDKYQIVDK